MKRFALLLVLILLLTGCAVAPAQESTAPSTTLPAKTEPVTTTPSTAPVTGRQRSLPRSLLRNRPSLMIHILQRRFPLSPTMMVEKTLFTTSPPARRANPTLVSNFLVSQYGWKSEELGLPALSAHDAKNLSHHRQGRDGRS